MVNRLHPDQLVTRNGTAEELRRFIETEFQIRAGLCPNGCGLMAEDRGGQRCMRCAFWCNTLPDPSGDPH